MKMVVAPAWGRGLKFRNGGGDTIKQCRPRMGAWIEIFGVLPPDAFGAVAPAWGRGLKSGKCKEGVKEMKSPPHGGVD